MSATAQDTDVTLRDGELGASLCWRRGCDGSRVTCVLADVLGITVVGQELHVAHYPLSQEFGCCSASEASRRPEPHRIRCADEAAARDWQCRVTDALGRRPRHIAVFVNPVGGIGRALSLYETQVLPLLKLAGVRVSLTLTERVGHATEVASRLDVASSADAVDAVLVVSGDGLLSEVYNGLMQHAHPDAAKLPLGVVPAGSGNAVAKSLASRSGEACNVLNATLAALCCSDPTPLDAALVLQPGARPTHALLSLSWALVADIDIESEALRALGAARFTLQALVRCAMLRHYAGRLLFMPLPEHAASAAAGRPATAEEAARACALGAADDVAGAASEERWRVLDGPLESVWALNLPWGGEDALAAPSAHLDDGAFDVVVFHGGSALQIAAALMAMDSGEHVGHDCVTVVKASAFALEPGEPHGGSGGVLVLDGELVARRAPSARPMPLHYAPLLVRVRRGAACALARPPSVPLSR